MTTRENEIKSASDLLSKISNDFGEDGDVILFRGQPHNWPLIPKIAKSPFSAFKGGFKTEQDALKFFKERSVSTIGRIPSNEWEWLFIAQHHGMPMRLLDWTSNALVALWFALRNEISGAKNDPSDPTMWAFEPRKDDWLNALDVNPFAIQRTQVVRPLHVTDRIIAQSGYFSAHKPYETEGFIPFDSRRLLQGKIVKYSIQRQNAKRVLRELDRCGINESVLFPNLDGLSGYMTWRWA